MVMSALKIAHALDLSIMLPTRTIELYTNGGNVQSASATLPDGYWWKGVSGNPDLATRLRRNIFLLGAPIFDSGGGQRTWEQTYFYGSNNVGAGPLPASLGTAAPALPTTPSA